MREIFREIDLGTFVDLALILLAATLVIVASQRFLPWLAERIEGPRRLWLLALVPLIRLIVIVGAAVLCVPLFIEPSLKNMFAVFGALGLALGFALKDYASSLIAGVIAVGETPYRNGDWVEIQGVYGEVTHVGMRTVRLRTNDDTIVYVPHQILWTAPIRNANDGSSNLLCVASVYLAPDHDPRRCRELLQDVLATSAYINLDMPMMVRLQESPWHSEYQLKAYPLDPRLQFAFLSELHERAKQSLRAAQLPLLSAADGRLPQGDSLPA